VGSAVFRSDHCAERKKKYAHWLAQRDGIAVLALDLASATGWAIAQRLSVDSVRADGHGRKP
jgi:hypothetical protein